MNDLGALLAIAGALLVGAISPGPSFVMVAQTALSNSRRAGLRLALGVSLGSLAFSLIALSGLIAVITALGWLFTVIKIAGGLFIVYLAVKTWRGARNPVPTTPLDTGGNGVVRGFLVQVSNPKTAVVYASVFAAFLPASPAVWLYLAIPPAVFLVEAVWYLAVAVSLSYARPRSLYSRAKTWVDRVAALVLGALGVRLLLTAGSRGV